MVSSTPDWIDGYHAGREAMPLQTPADFDPELWLDGFLKGEEDRKGLVALERSI